MKKSIIGVVVVLSLIVIMLGGYIKNSIEASKETNDQAKIQGYEVDLEKGEYGIEKNQFAPDFTLQTITGETVTLSDLKGKNVILNFWATWCPPCKEEMPHLRDYYKQFAKQDNVEIVAVNLTYTENSSENAKLFADSYKLTFPILLMEDDSISNQYQVITIPSTFIIDSNGKIQRQILGPINEESIRDYISQLNEN